MLRVVVAVGIVVVLGGAAVAAALLFFSGVTLRSDPAALARLRVQTFGGRIEHVAADGADGTPIAVSVAHGRLTPLAQVSPGERITVTVVVKRPGWSAWLLGKTRREHLTVVAPDPQIATRWVTARDGRAVIRFDVPLERASVAGKPAAVAGRTVSITAPTGAGAARVMVAARTWERLGAPQRVTWFPATTHDAVLVEPKPGLEINPVEPVRLTFSRTVSSVLGTKHPTFAARVSGRWLQPDSHTLVFQPSGYGFGFAASLRLRLPSPAIVLPATGTQLKSAIPWSTAPASFTRLQQLLAEEGYLPLDWAPEADDTPHTMRAEMQAAIDPPAGRFTWRYPNTPEELQALWEPGQPNTIIRGAVMMFEDEHKLAVDGIAGARVWQAVLQDAAAGKRRAAGYSYVYVHRDVPQLMTLWHAGKVVLTSPGNTGVPAAPTTLGTFPVFEHIPVGRMSGTNPDGSHYDDPGIRWISYFHQGEALHAFNRASFGTPQSLGCVELPLAAAAKVWPYTPIGTLVTIEN